MKKIVLASLLSSVLTLPMMASAGNDSGFYIGASLGQSSFDQVNLEDETVGYKLMAGYNFGLIPLIDVAIEADYRDFGSFSDNGNDADITSYDLFAVGALTIAPFIAPFVKVGFSGSDTNLDITDNLEDSSSDLAAGLGLKVSFMGISVRGEYEFFDRKDDQDLDMFSLGVTYTF